MEELREELRDELRLIANPIHLGNIKINKHIERIVFSDKLKETLEINYSDVFLSELNIIEISKLIDDYIDNLIIERVVTGVLNEVIFEVIENSDKFDFCLPFD